MGERIAGELNTREIFCFYQSFGQELMTNDKRQKFQFLHAFLCLFETIFYGNDAFLFVSGAQIRARFEKKGSSSLYFVFALAFYWFSSRRSMDEWSMLCTA